MRTNKRRKHWYRIFNAWPMWLSSKLDHITHISIVVLTIRHLLQKPCFLQTVKNCHLNCATCRILIVKMTLSPSYWPSHTLELHNTTKQFKCLTNMKTNSFIICWLNKLLATELLDSWPLCCTIYTESCCHVSWRRRSSNYRISKKKWV